MSVCVVHVCRSLSVKPFWFVGVYGNCSLSLHFVYVHVLQCVHSIQGVCIVKAIIATSPNGK